MVLTSRKFPSFSVVQKILVNPLRTLQDLHPSSLKYSLSLTGRDAWSVSSAFISVYLKYLFTCLVAFTGLELQGSTLFILSFTRMMNIYQIPFTMLGIQWLKRKTKKRCSSHFYRTFSLMVHKSKQVLLI